MGCCDKTVNVFYQDGSIHSRSTSVCQDITADLLTMFKVKIDCILNNNMSGLINRNVEELTNAQQILANWIALKEVEPESCTYFEYMPLMQELVKTIVMANLCI